MRLIMDNIKILMIINFIWIALGAGLIGFAFSRRKKLPARLSALMSILGLIAICGGIIITLGLKAAGK